MLRLKQKNADETYPGEICAAARCLAPAVIVDRTGRLNGAPVPLCDYHWQVRCALEDEPPATAAPAAEQDTVTVGVSSAQLRLPFTRR